MTNIKHSIPVQLLDRFCVAGINYQKADVTVRGSFAVTKEDFIKIGQLARLRQVRSVFVISTCNRTEIYGFTDDVMALVDLLLSHSKGSYEEFLANAYLKSGEAALEHLYRVASGLDSQILGDYEILSQLKQSVDLARENGLIGPVMERTVNYALQASKKIKTATALSSGTVSVSYAAIELLNKIPGIASKKILVFGAGKFGGNVCRNLKEYLPGTSVRLVNRTDATAWQMAEKNGIGFIPYSQLAEGIREADIIIVCTHAAEPTILPEQFTGCGSKLLLDLSVPANVHAAVKELDAVRVIDVDEISALILDKTFAKRKLEVPQALQILEHYRREFINWLEEYRYSLHIKNWKGKLQQLQPRPSGEMHSQKAVTRLAVNLKTSHEKGCLFINAINDYLQMS